MKRLLLISLTLCVANLLAAATPDSLWRRANEAYAAANYTEAIQAYKDIQIQGLTSASLYYNMGSCYYKLKQYTEAILWLERAKLLTPNDPDILYNLEQANRFCLDKITSRPEFFLHTWLNDVKNALSLRQWAWLSLFLLAGTAVLLLLFFYARGRGLRRLTFYMSIIMIILCLGAFSMGWSQKRHLEQKAYAIVFAPVASVKSSPDQQGKDLFMIHGGTKVKILERVGTWNRVELADGRQGWMELTQMEQI